MKGNKPDGSTQSVRLSGEIDHHTADKIRDRLDKLIDKTAPKCLVLDFSAVTMMDSSGIGLVIGRYKRLKKIGAELYVQGTTESVDKIFQLAGLYQIVKRI